MTTRPKRVIVNADDFGRTPGVNRGVIDAHRNGIVTSTTLMVNHAAAPEAVSLAKQFDDLGLGLHMALTGGRPSSPVERVASLVDSRGLLPSAPEVLADADPKEVLAECRAQLHTFRQLVGRDPTHVDTHHHAHDVPAVFEALITLAWETGLPLRSTTPEMRGRLRREGVPTTDTFDGRFHGDGANLETLLRILGELSAGTTELMCHPAVVDEELKTGSRYAEPRARELTALSHREARQLLQAAGVRLVHYGMLVARA